MIDPLRYRSLQEQLEFDEDNSPMQCWQCLRERVSTPAFFLCHDCGKVGASRPFCEPCFFDYHLTRKRGKDGHKPHPIVQGDPVIVQTLADGDGVTFAKMHDWVTLDYTLTADESDVAIEDTFLTKQPLTFQSGCSGPCIHLQLFGCTEIAAADIMGASDPYCAVYWKDNFVGVTSTKHMTLNPTWANQTFVLPLAAEFMTALGSDEGSSTLFDAGALLPALRIELYDWDRLSKDDFLGQATVSDAEILHILRQVRSGETGENQIRSFDLKPKQSRGQLGIRVALRGNKVFIHVMQAKNIPKADPFSLSDPYCEVYWNDQRIGKTVHIDDTLDPVWDLEIFSVKVDNDGPKSIEQSTLRIVCLDWDQFGSDDVLGQIELAGWQIQQMVESKDGDDVDAGEGAMGEAEMEKVFDFLRLLQEHETGEAGLGKMVVGVPQDPNILKEQNQQQVSQEVEVDPAPPKKKRQKKRKHGGTAEAGSAQRDGHGNGGNRAEKEESKNHQTKEQQDITGSGVDAATSSKREVQPAGGEAEPAVEIHPDPIQESNAAAAVAVVDPAEHMEGEGRPRQEGDQGVGEREGQGGTPSTKEESGPPFDQQRPSDNTMSPREDGEKDRAAASALGEGQKSTAGDSTGGLVNAGSSKDGQASLLKLAPEREKVLGSSRDKDEKFTQDTVELNVELGDIEEGGAQGITAQTTHNHIAASAAETEAADMVGDQTPSSQAPRKVGETLEKLTTKEKLAQDATPPGAGRVEGGPQPDRTSAPASPSAKRKGKAKNRNSVAFVYRDANVQRFEEDQGVLVEYLDDGSSAWVDTKFIPRLQIRAEAPTPRNIFRRLWDQRSKVLNLHKRVMNVKRGMRVLMGVAMTGSRMQWHQLELTDEQSGANFVRGTVNCRFLYHTRGSVLRGLDVAVSHMSLGERARIEVRSDYGFGEVYASRNVPPYASLVFVAQVAAIRHHNAKWLIIRRALKDKAEDALFRFRSYLSSAASSYGVVSRFLHSLRSLRRKKNVEEIMPTKEEESMGTVLGVEEGEGPKARDADTKLL